GTIAAADCDGRGARRAGRLEHRPRDAKHSLRRGRRRSADVRHGAWGRRRVQRPCDVSSGASRDRDRSDGRAETRMSWRNRTGYELDDEIEQHLEDRYRELVAGGMPAEDASRLVGE